MARTIIATLEPGTTPATTAPEGEGAGAQASKTAFPFAMSYILPSRRPMLGEVFDVNLNGCVLVFPRERCPHFTCEADAVLQLRVIATGRTLAIPARHAATYAAGDKRQCWFEFKDPSDLLERLDNDVRPYFNRRGAFRVEPPEGMRVAVAIEWKDGQATGVLGNISATGIAIDVSAPAAARLAATKELTLRCCLPGADGPFRMAGNVCSSRPTQLGMCFGIAFNPSLTPDFKDHEARIVKYVIRRQLETLKARAGEKA